MRRTASSLSLVLLGVGVFLLELAPLLARYVEPRAERTPTDVDVTTVLTGTGEYFDTKNLRPVRDKPITITRRVLGDVAASERSGRAVWTCPRPSTRRTRWPYATRAGRISGHWSAG